MGDGFADIVEDHRKVERMLDEYRNDPEDGLAREVCTEIAVHAEAEELALYPRLHALGSGASAPAGDDDTDGRALAERAELEHSGVTAQIARVLAAPPIDLEEPMRQIREQILAHAEWEEREMLPKLRAVLDAAELHEALTAAKETIRSRAGEPMY